ncbi:DUF3019 domain-containing protein [Marinibactrum halimedae]|uniref:DUF3019 domain-containing protein n=1 Tax=Marinibactrum halimedae TaxID=1444977 RepID=UPI001E306720|nr:DUF3019 domain-containing protein [Marinibactrum halimedae]MCD9457598.1 DUF3019 domain-containing protein [Marinibactrum halimedae]
MNNTVSIRRYVGYLCTFIIFLHSVLALAEDNSTTLTITPTLCLTDNPERICHMNLQFYWQAKLSGNYCLADNLDRHNQQRNNLQSSQNFSGSSSSQTPEGSPPHTATLQCWAAHKEGEWHKKYLIEESKIFFMTQTHSITESKSNNESTHKNQFKTVAEESVEVLSTHTKDRRKNRRRRHIWSLL